MTFRRRWPFWRGVASIAEGMASVLDIMPRTRCPTVEEALKRDRERVDEYLRRAGLEPVPWEARRR